MFFFSLANEEHVRHDEENEKKEPIEDVMINISSVNESQEVLEEV